MDAKVIQLFKGKKPSWIESLSYSELLSERRYIKCEFKRISAAIKSVYKIDPRGALWPEVKSITDKIDEVEAGYKVVLEMVQLEMIKRMKENK